MSTFGDIVEPVSRTFCEDWDDMNQELNHKELKWQHNPEAPKEIKTLFIFEGRYLSDYIRAQTSGKLVLLNSIPEVNLHLLKSQKSNNYLCTIKDYDLVFSSEIVELLRPYLIVSDYVLAVQAKALSEYLTSEVVTQDHVIRSVNTSKTLGSAQPMSLNFRKLEQPNIISGVSAGVISLREHLDLPATGVVCYLENPEEHQIEELEKLMQKLELPQNAKSTPSSILNSNLYI